MALTIPLCFAPAPVRYNHGLALLSALLKARGIGTELCVLSDGAAFLGRLDAWTVPLVCFSATTQRDYELCVPFMRLAHQRGRGVLLGGTWASLGRPVDASVDLVCRGDGETLPDFLLAGDDRLFHERLVCEDLNALPLPDYDLFAGIPFDRGLPNSQGKRYLPYFSSRGCPYPCRFCQVRVQPGGYRVRTRVEEDLRPLVARFCPDVVFIGDAHLPYASAAWRASWGEFRHPFVAYIRADATPAQLDWLIDRGLVGCAFGVESGDERYRNEVLRKHLTDDHIWATVARLQRAGVWYVPFFMRGTPDESFAHQTATARMARRLGPHSIIWQYEELGTWASPQQS